MSNIYEDAHLGHVEKPGPSQEIGNISSGKGIIMGNNTTKEPKNKAFREWIRSIGTFIGGLGILIGLINFLFTKEKEASDRLLNIIKLLDSKNCKMVRSGAASTIGVYLEDYKEVADQEDAEWIKQVVSQLKDRQGEVRDIVKVNMEKAIFGAERRVQDILNRARFAGVEDTDIEAHEEVILNLKKSCPTVTDLVQSPLQVSPHQRCLGGRCEYFCFN